jgi:hypothetical protein
MISRFRKFICLALILAGIPIHSAEETVSDQSAQEAQSTSNTITTQVRDSSLGLVIKGNQELPNVLYIIPWQKGPSNVISPIQGRIVDEVFGSAERNVFERRVNLHRQLNRQPIKQ